MTKKIIIPLYKSEKDMFAEALKENRNVRSYTAYSLIRSGIQHYKEDSAVNFSQTISVPVYPSKDKVDEIYLLVEEEDPVYQYLQDMTESLHISRTKIARYFLLYDWRHETK